MARKGADFIVGAGARAPDQEAQSAFPPTPPSAARGRPIVPIGRTAASGSKTARLALGF